MPRGEIFQGGLEVREPCLACGVGQERKYPLKAGIFNIDKPKGLTSHQVVERVRRASGIRKVGHAGTLDPLATGVLLVCFGQATRVTEYLMGTPKLYRARVELGVATDTEDAEGKVISHSPIGDLGLPEIEKALATLRGSIQQVPPIYSAIKKEGVPLYRWARRGVIPQPEPREVEIYRLDLLAWTPPFLEIEVECSPGTYIRALARDLGQRLGCGAHLASLIRLASGRFTLQEAVSLQEVEEGFASGDWQRLAHPLDEALLQFEPLLLDGETERRVLQGQSISGEPLETSLARAYNSSGGFIALLSFQDGEWKPKKVFKPRCG